MDTQCHDIAKLCLQDVRLAMILSEYASGIPRRRVFWKLRAIILPTYASKMSDCGTLGELKATILSEYASEMLRWRAFWKLDAIILANHASEMSDCGTLGKLKTMILSEYASEMVHWKAFWKLDAIHSVAKVCLQDVRLEKS